MAIIFNSAVNVAMAIIWLAIISSHLGNLPEKQRQARRGGAESHQKTNTNPI
jgi:hypothetical protein